MRKMSDECFGNGVRHFSSDDSRRINRDREVVVSVVVPIYNEEQNIAPLCEQIRDTLDTEELSWELVLVDDGSWDDSFAVMKRVCLEDRRVRAVRLRRNFGQTAALAAGFDHAAGAVIVTMDGDLQNDPSDIPRLLRKMDEGYDVVSGWRKDRKDPYLSKKLPSKVANQIAQRMTRVPLHDFGCTLKAYRREVIDHIQLYGELHRFIPAVASSFGVCIAEIEVKHHPRRHGKTKYGVSRMLRGLLDLLALRFLLNYMTRPIQVFGGLGILMMLIAAASGAVTLFMRLFLNVDMTGNPLLYLTILSIVMSMQFISLGFLGEMCVRIYYEGTKKPTYAVHEVVGEDSQPPVFAAASGR